MRCAIHASRTNFFELESPIVRQIVLAINQLLSGRLFGITPNALWPANGFETVVCSLASSGLEATCTESRLFDQVTAVMFAHEQLKSAWS
jgi:hypothetical protein